MWNKVKGKISSLLLSLSMKISGRKVIIANNYILVKIDHDDIKRSDAWHHQAMTLSYWVKHNPDTFDNFDEVTISLDGNKVFEYSN